MSTNIEIKFLTSVCRVVSMASPRSLVALLLLGHPRASSSWELAVRALAPPSSSAPAAGRGAAPAMSGGAAPGSRGSGSASSPVRRTSDNLVGMAGTTVPKTIDWLLKNNREWVDAINANEPQFFEQFASGQSPSYLWIGCSDSRVPANRILGLDVGEVFVHRNVANLALGSDMNCMSVLQYAVTALKIPHIIVCGHYDCGGVRAALENSDHASPLENWLRNIRDVYRIHRDEIDALEGEARARRLVELNVIEQCINIFKTGVVQRRRLETHHAKLTDTSVMPYTQPRIHAMVYSPADGILKELPVNFPEIIQDLKGIYDLFDTGEVVALPNEVEPEG